MLNVKKEQLLFSSFLQRAWASSVYVLSSICLSPCQVSCFHWYADFFQRIKITLTWHSEAFDATPLSFKMFDTCIRIKVGSVFMTEWQWQWDEKKNKSTSRDNDTCMMIKMFSKLSPHSAMTKLQMEITMNIESWIIPKYCLNRWLFHRVHHFEQQSRDNSL